MELTAQHTAIPDGATDFTDDGFRVTYYRRCEAFNMRLLERFDGNQWQMCSYHPWADLKPVAPHNEPAIRPLTPAEKFQRVVSVAGWDSGAVERLCQTCAEKGMATMEQYVEYAQKVLDNQCLSQLRGGDPALDAMVAEAFRDGHAS